MNRRLVRPGDLEWPRALPWDGELWVEGEANLAELSARSIAIVGARACTFYGEFVARDLALDLGRDGWTIVSGGAYGIDAAAHRGCIADPCTPTIAVLPGGLDKPYPIAHASLFGLIQQAGGLLVSPFPLGTIASRAHFLERNRLIAALCDGMVVVEGAPRSGSLSAANRAQELNKPLMAVPGPVTSVVSALPHQLIREGKAALVTNADDVAHYIALRSLEGELA